MWKPGTGSTAPWCCVDAGFIHLQTVLGRHHQGQVTMKTKVISILSIIIFAGSVAVYTAPPGKDTILRFTLVVGSNYGGKGRERLRYAVSDARSMMQVLEKMGGVNDTDSMLLVEPDRNEFMKALAGMKSKISRARSSSRRIEVIFYYSGHSDQEGILLGNQKVGYSTIRRGIKNMPADVRIAILDSCSSGAFTRLKGGTMQAPFMVDSSYNMKGYAFLTSSSSNEASQESELIKGSFFTHFLVTGLRGAADILCLCLYRAKAYRCGCHGDRQRGERKHQRYADGPCQHC